MSLALDDIDRRILGALQADGRLPIRTLAERVQISRANAYSRLERLTSNGVITGFTALVDPVKSGLATSAYITLTIRQDTWRELQERIRDIPEVQHMALVGGEFDVILLVRAADNAALRDVVLDVLQAIPGVHASRTFLIFDDVDNRTKIAAYGT